MIDIKEYENKKCEGCSKELNLEDWPYLFRGLIRLCKICKLKAFNVLKNERRT